MKKSKVESDIFNQNYLSVVQILMKLADPTFLFGEVGRGIRKTTHMLSPRVDRVQNDMPGAVLVLGASTYKSIFDNILAGLIGYFQENYIRGIYYEVGKEPPRHFKPCTTFIDDWRPYGEFSYRNGDPVRELRSAGEYAREKCRTPFH